MQKSKSTDAAPRPGGLPVSAIPGLGPIRARALAKAGWTDTTALKRATLTDLASVPGITQAKAQYVLDFVRNGDQPTAPTPTAARPARRTTAKTATTAPRSTTRTVDPKDGKAPRAKPAPRPKTPPLTPLQRAAKDVAFAATTLLQSEHAVDFNRRFARQLGKLVVATEQIAADPLTDTVEAERMVSQLRKIDSVLAEAAEGRLGDKRQDKLAEDLRGRRHKLERADAPA